jgi:2-(1,2-epoxy-1,2-dihydrophenyl)acetyl-CoA isomerase
MPKPVIAAVNGPAAGFGCSIAMASDVVIAAESAYCLLAFARIGLTPDGGASLIVGERAGLGRALRMGLLAERVLATEALAWGLADEVVPDGELQDRAESLAAQLASGPTRAYAATKHALNAALLPALAEQLEREATLQSQLVASEDFNEDLAAFTAGRPPRFRGR